MRGVTRPSVLLAACVVAVACAPDPAATCGGATCDDGERCVGGQCRVACSLTVPCPGNALCEGGVCASGGASSGTSQGPGSTGGGSGSSSSTPVTASSSRGVSSSSSSSWTSSSSSAAASTSGGNGCQFLDDNCHVGSWTGTGCEAQYKCPYGQVCVAPDNHCAAYPAPPQGTDPAGGECYILHVERRTYLICNLLGSWADTQAYCQASFPGFTLGTLHTQAEHNGLAGFLNGGRGWLGLTDQAAEGTFAWADGVALTFGGITGQTPWCTGQPDNSGGNEDCVEFIGGAGTDCWADADCAATDRALICSR